MNSIHLRLFVLSICAAGMFGCASTTESDTETAAASADTSETVTSGDAATADATRSPAVPTDQGQTFIDLDVNKDGSLSMEEVTGNEMLRTHFSAADKDGNGSLSAAEVEAHRTEMSGRP